MLTKYEMLFKTDTVCQKADANNQMLKNVNMIYQVTNTERKSWNMKKKKKTNEESEYVTVPKQCKNHIDSYVPVVTSLLCYAFPT